MFGIVLGLHCGNVWPHNALRVSLAHVSQLPLPSASFCSQVIGPYITSKHTAVGCMLAVCLYMYCLYVSLVVPVVIMVFVKKLLNENGFKYYATKVILYWKHVLKA